VDHDQCVSISKPAIMLWPRQQNLWSLPAGQERLAKDVVVEGESSSLCACEMGTEELVVDSVPAAQHRAPLVMAPSMPATMLQKKVPAKERPCSSDDSSPCLEGHVGPKPSPGC